MFKYRFNLKLFVFMVLLVVLFPPFKVVDAETIYFNKTETEYVIDNANILSSELKEKINNNSTMVSEELNLNIIFISVPEEIPINKIDYSKNLVNYWGLSNTSTVLVGFYPYSTKEPIKIYNTKYVDISDNEKKLFEESLYNHQEKNTLNLFIKNVYKELLKDDIKTESKIETIFKSFKIKNDGFFHNFKRGLSAIFLPQADMLITKLSNKLCLI